MLDKKCTFHDCFNPATKGSILCEEHKKASQELTKALEEEQEEARQKILAQDLLRQHYA
jgi:hypothetical protein